MISDQHGETLGTWARRIGVCYRTAWRWYRQGDLPSGVVAEQMPTGTILIRDMRAQRDKVRSTVIYARINPREPRSSLDEQIATCRRFCAAKGWVVDRIVRELAPGVGSRRTKLARLIDERVPRMVVGATSVLSQFDFVFYEALWEAMGGELVVVDRSAPIGGEGGALEDLTDAINITCHRHYGQKRGEALAEMLTKVVSGQISV